MALAVLLLGGLCLVLLVSMLAEGTMTARIRVEVPATGRPPTPLRLRAAWFKDPAAVAADPEANLHLRRFAHPSRESADVPEGWTEVPAGGTVLFEFAWFQSGLPWTLPPHHRSRTLAGLQIECAPTGSGEPSAPMVRRYLVKDRGLYEVRGGSMFPAKGGSVLRTQGQSWTVVLPPVR